MFRICVVTGTRAEYGLLKPLLQLLRDDADFCLQIIATGAHLSPEFGYTIQSITNDGFCVTETLEMLLSSDSAVGVTKSLGLACIGFADALNRLNPNLVILLGDRYEILAAAQCALIAGIPIAHLHGGEITEGAIDDSIRHAITKMSALHFASTPNNCKRIVQMGENPHCVFHVGAIGLDNLSPELLATREQLEQDLKLPLTGPVALVTLHPETCASPEMAEEHARTLVSAPRSFSRTHNHYHGRKCRRRWPTHQQHPRTIFDCSKTKKCNDFLDSVARTKTLSLASFNSRRRYWKFIQRNY